MTSPFIFDVAGLLMPQASPERRRNHGPSPERIGAEMIAIPRGAEVTVEAVLTPLGEAIMVDADISATLSGQCVRCLRELHPTRTFHLNEVYTNSEDLISGDAAEGEEDTPPQVIDDRIDLLQAVTDEVGLSLPYNPVCEGGCPTEHAEDEGLAPAPDGVSGEHNSTVIDPRWAGLEKFR